MSKRPADTECASKQARLTPKDAEIPNQGAAAAGAAVVIGDTNEGSPPKIFKLDIDCFEAVADYLSVKDLHALGQTCKRFQKMAGYVFKETYPAIRVKCLIDGIYINDGAVQLNGFCDYIQDLTIETGNMDCFRFIKSNSFSSIKRIRISEIYLTKKRIACIKHILDKSEIVEVRECEMAGEFHAKFLQFCTSMKHLAVRPKDGAGYDSDDEIDFDGPGIVIGDNNDWMLRQYPMLEKFELTKTGCFSGTPRPEFGTFLERNPNIRALATSADWHWSDAADLKLDVFAIDCNDDLESSLVSGILDNLVKMNEKGENFFERLHFYSYGITAEWHTCHIEKISKMEKLYMHSAWIGPMEMENLKEVRLRGFKDILYDATDHAKEILVDGMVNLERVSFGGAGLVDILSFICGSRKLAKFRIESFAEGALQNGAINLLAWNNQRKQLDGARKVTIYVDEEVYLATKWASHHGQTDFDFVELKRHASHDWNHLFGY